MKPPEKIYRRLEGTYIKYYDYKPAKIRYNEKEPTEYIRANAFIEKAEKFFTEKFEVEDYNENIDIDGSPIFNYGRFIDDFKNYMKGE